MKRKILSILGVILITASVILLLVRFGDPIVPVKDRVIEQAQQQVVRITGLPIEDQVLDLSNYKKLDSFHITISGYDYYFQAKTGRLKTAFNLSTMELYLEEKNTQIFNENDAAGFVLRNVRLYDEEIKNPQVQEVYYVEMEGPVRFYKVRVADIIQGDFATGNESTFIISSLGIFLMANNDYEDRSITENVNPSQFISKEEALRIMKENDKNGYMMKDNKSLISYLQSNRDKLVWRIHPVGGNIQDYYVIDARTGKVLIVPDFVRFYKGANDAN
jgi:ABC-type antimicrobial peptide transport system permease subunit